MRIGLSSIIADGFGSGSFTFGEVPSGGGFPPYGSLAYIEYGAEYSAGGGVAGTVLITGTNFSNTYYTQLCDLPYYNDGVGGVFLDFGTATNIRYKPFGTLCVSGVPDEHPAGYVNIWGGEYPTALAGGYDYYHDGAGSVYVVDWNVTANNNNILTDDYVNSTSQANYYMVNIGGTGTFLGNGRYTRYTITGVGTYSASNDQGSYYSSGTPTGVYDPNTNNEYYWNGSGGYY